MKSTFCRQLAINHRIYRIALLVLVFLAPSGCARAQQGYLGAAFDFMDPMSSAKYGLNFGAVVVVHVVPGSPAEKSGLRPGDLITSVDGAEMRSPDQVAKAFRAHKPGDKARAGIIHPMGDRNMALDIMVTIGKAPANYSNTWNGNAPGNRPGNGAGAAPGNSPSPGNGGQWNPAPQGGYEQQRGSTAPRGVGGGQGGQVTPAQRVQVQMAQQGPCRAAVFPGWQLAPGPNGQSADVYGPNGAHVAWGIPAVNPAMRQFYGDLYGPPDVHAAAFLAIAIQARPQYTSTENVGNYFTAHQFRAGANTGVLLYHAYPAPNGQYIISEYSAWARQGDDEMLSQAIAIMSSLQCTASIRPSQPPSAGGRRSSGSSENDTLKDYNSILGTQYVHDPSTGQTYYVSQDQMSNGQEGEGYYVGTGVNRHKLAPGLE
jgi:hypothetical protein